MKIRGQKRYYRNLSRPVPFGRAVEEWIRYLHRPGRGPCYDTAFYDQFEYSDWISRIRAVANRPEFEPGYDYDHVHCNPAHPLFRWKAIKPHLDAMIRTFDHMEQVCTDVERPFQCWIFLGIQPDFGLQPIFYFHTPNAYWNDFPYTLPEYATTGSLRNPKLDAYLKELAEKGYTVLYSPAESPFPQIVIYKEGFGASLATGRTV